MQIILLMIFNRTVIRFKDARRQFREGVLLLRTSNIQSSFRAKVILNNTGIKEKQKLITIRYNM